MCTGCLLVLACCCSALLALRNSVGDARASIIDHQCTLTECTLLSTALAMQADRLLKEGLELAVTRSSDVDAEIQKVMLYTQCCFVTLFTIALHRISSIVVPTMLSSSITAISTIAARTSYAACSCAALH
jgi:hypothetical protein